MKRYYDERAPEYDATTYELAQQDPVAASDLAELEQLLAGFTPGRWLDIGCGTGWLTRVLRGPIVAVDQSQSMLRKARTRTPHALFVRADVPPLPFLDRTFDRALASHVYSHIEDEVDRRAFIDEALRVAADVVIVEHAWQFPWPKSGTEQRFLADGTQHDVFKRYFTAGELASELGAAVILVTTTFIAVQISSRGRGEGTERLPPEVPKPTLFSLSSSQSRTAK